MSFNFQCPKCNTEQMIDLPAPEPNYAAERYSDSENCNEDEEFVCTKCKAFFTADIWNSLGNAWYDVNDDEGARIIESSFDCDVYHEPDGEEEEFNWWLESNASHFFTELQNHLSNAQRLVFKILENSYESENIKQSVAVMLYGHIVAAFEGYLELTFCNKVFNSEEALKKFVISHPEMKKEKFSLAEVFDVHSNIRDKTKKYLKDTIFHNLGKAKEMYSASFGYDFGDIEELCKAVSIRHDCVHRAGRNKEGSVISITPNQIKELISRVDEFSKKLEEHFIDGNDDEA